MRSLTPQAFNSPGTEDEKDIPLRKEESIRSGDVPELRRGMMASRQEKRQATRARSNRGGFEGKPNLPNGPIYREN